MVSRLVKAWGNKTTTENGAETFKSTLSELLDLFYHAPARRGRDNTQLFSNSYRENKALTIKTAFYVRDVRGGQGERETFRQFLRWLSKNHSSMFNKIVSFVPEYGRWDDILEFTYNDVVVDMVRDQLKRDIDSANPSLLAKWMPSNNTSSLKTRKLAQEWESILDFEPKYYRKVLSLLRKRINIVERNMSLQNWNKINYEGVPSKAMNLYRKAFSRHDPEGFVSYLEEVKKGTKTIKAATLYPYELVGKYLEGHREDALEAQWKALPNYAETHENAIVVCDVSGSMMTGVGDVPPIHVSISLALYLAERNKGAFRDYVITFSGTPELVKVQGDSLYERIHNLSRINWGANTNLQGVFEELLRVAKRNKLTQEDMPTKLFIVSDMQFDAACRGKTNFEAMRDQFENAGYELPTVVFWNVDSRKNETPVPMDEGNVYLVSGCSPSVFGYILGAKAINPYEMMLEVLNSPRYAQLDEVL